MINNETNLNRDLTEKWPENRQLKTEIKQTSTSNIHAVKGLCEEVDKINCTDFKVQ